MKAIQAIASASLFAISAIIAIPSYAEERAETTVSEFLTWERTKQDSFFAVSILTAGVIATQIRPDFADCIGNWYSQNEDRQSVRHSQMLKLMEEFPDYIPSGIVIAVLQKECGDFGSL